MLHAEPRRRPRALSGIAIVLIAIAAGWIVSLVLPNYFVFLGITAIVSAISLLGLGIVTGSAGMIALCQLSFAAMGAWTVTALNSIGAPGGLFLWLVAGTVVAGAGGLLIGLPALRLRGVNLAVVTLGFAAAVDVTIVKFQFPGSSTMLQVQRPSLVLTDRNYLFFCLVVFLVLAAVMHVLQRGKTGTGWRTVAFSERAVAAAGASVAGLKLLAFALSAAIGGLSGGLLVGQIGGAYPASFSTMQSLAFYLLSIIVGTQFGEMALLAGIVMVAIPELLKRFGISQDWGLVIFGITGIQALATNSTLGQQIRDGIARRRRRRSLTRTSAADPQRPAPAVDPAPPAQHSDVALDEPLLEVRGLTVTYGTVTALDHVDLDVPSGRIVGLIGPNGAGKSTLVDAVSGFLANHEGTVQLAGRSLDGTPPNRRARGGLRRTFQQARVPSDMTVGGYVAFVARSGSTSAEIADLLREFDCPPPESRLADSDVGTRRLIEVVAHISSKPRVLMLDEPAAGFSHEEHVRFGERLRRIPARFGVSILLIEHDLDLVRSVCDTIVVLDFGRVIAAGDPESVLRSQEVLEAYMGEVQSL
ncbi:ATP-binding cassette domain-containing protein [uncultured Microbacterium sp.]|uniref:branched-chain amino acid ABC transporter ATP-binding protein/permease n=1 Tax=uncultured Microbacterium sp. TaxID=191216 RepID=UPI0035CCA684